MVTLTLGEQGTGKVRMNVGSMWEAQSMAQGVQEMVLVITRVVERDWGQEEEPGWDFPRPCGFPDCYSVETLGKTRK